MVSPACECATIKLARRRVACRIKPRNGGRAGVVHDAQTAGAAHGTLKPQGNLKLILEGVDTSAIEREEKVWLRQSPGRLQGDVSPVEPGIDHFIAAQPARDI